MISLKQVKQFYQAVLKSVKIEYKKIQDKAVLIKLRKNYVPRYGQRTETEHAVIRSNIKRDRRDCLHLKGGRVSSRVLHKDFAISFHTFIDGSSRVKCLLCGRKWASTDLEAVMMLSCTSNHPSSSEGAPSAPKAKTIGGSNE